MIYVQYFQKSATSEELVEACGDRAVVVLDGRQSTATQKVDAISLNGTRRPTYLAYQLFRGETFTRSEAITGIISL